MLSIGIFFTYGHASSARLAFYQDACMTIFMILQNLIIVNNQKRIFFKKIEDIFEVNKMFIDILNGAAYCDENNLYRLADCFHKAAKIATASQKQVTAAEGDFLHEIGDWGEALLPEGKWSAALGGIRGLLSGEGVQGSFQHAATTGGLPPKIKMALQAIEMLIGYLRENPNTAYFANMLSDLLPRIAGAIGAYRLFGSEGPLSAGAAGYAAGGIPGIAVGVGAEGIYDNYANNTQNQLPQQYYASRIGFTKQASYQKDDLLVIDVICGKNKYLGILPKSTYDCFSEK
jgi:hypothetical protein